MQAPVEERRIDVACQSRGRGVADVDDAFEGFFGAEYRSVLKTAFLIVRDQQRAEDIAQDAFVQLYRHWPTVSHYERPEAWVRRVAIRLAVRDVERARAREVLEPKFPTPFLPDSSDLTVLDAVKQLPPMQRAAIALFYLEDSTGRRDRRTPFDIGVDMHRPPDAGSAPACGSFGTGNPGSAYHDPA